MRWLVPIAIVLAACGQESGDPGNGDELVRRRRIALGLDSAPLRFRKGMQMLRSRESEALLKRETDEERLLEEALHIENVFSRVRLETAEERSIDPDAFDRRVKETVDAAVALARERTQASARRLLEACTRCHVSFRESR